MRDNARSLQGLAWASTIVLDLQLCVHASKKGVDDQNERVGDDGMLNSGAEIRCELAHGTSSIPNDAAIFGSTLFMLSSLFELALP